VLFQSPDHIKVWGSADRDRNLLNPALDEGLCSASQTDSYNLLPFPEEETYIAYLMGGWVSFGSSEDVWHEAG
jgi:hypothetical protein